MNEDYLDHIQQAYGFAENTAALLTEDEEEQKNLLHIIFEKCVIPLYQFRDRPSQKQLDLAERLKINVTPTMTRRQLSTIISKKMKEAGKDEAES
jgi:hypothetical protein